MRPKVVTSRTARRRTYAYTGFRDEVGTVHHQTSTPTTILRLDYGYDKVHDRTYERYGASGSAGDAFAYDKARRLTTAWMGSVHAREPLERAVREEDRVQLRRRREPDLGGRDALRPVRDDDLVHDNSLNQYTAVGGTTHTWDANGNLTDNGTHKFKYNYKNLICRGAARVEQRRSWRRTSTTRTDGGSRRPSRAAH